MKYPIDTSALLQELHSRFTTSTSYQLVRHVKKVLREAEHDNDYPLQCECYEGLASIYRTVPDAAKELNAYKSMHKIAMLHSCSYWVQRSTINILPHLAMDERWEILLLSKNHWRTPLEEAYFHSSMARLAMETGNEQGMLDHAQQARQLLEQCSPKERLTYRCVRVFCSVHFLFMDYYCARHQRDIVLQYCDDIERYLLNNKTLLTKEQLNSELTKVCLGRGIAYGQAEEPKQAILHLETALSKYADESDPNYYTIQFNIASYYNDVHNTEKALHHATIASHGASQQGKEYLIYSVLILLGTIYDEKEEFKSAIQCYEKALRKINTSTTVNLTMKAELYRVWSNTCYNAMMYKEAFELSREYNFLMMDKYTNDLNTQISALGKKFHTDLQVQENKFLAREKNRLHKEQKRKNKELKQLGELHVSLLGGLEKLQLELNAMYEQHHRDIHLTAQITSLIATLDSVQQHIHRKTTSEFKAKIPHTFLPALQQVAMEPLTDLEVQIATLIHSGLSTKQMPHFLHRSEGYLLQVRRHLKRKLPLPSDISLKKFLVDL